MRIISLAALLFVGIFAIVVGYRIDQATLAVLAGVTVGFVVAAIAVGTLAFLVIRQNRQPTRSAHQSPIGDWAQPYHVQHPLPTTKQQQQLPAPAGPQYDDSVVWEPKKIARRWAVVDEVRS